MVNHLSGRKPTLIFLAPTFPPPSCSSHHLYHAALVNKQTPRAQAHVLRHTLPTHVFTRAQVPNALLSYIYEFLLHSNGT